MVKREAELSRQFNEQMKGGAGTTEVIRVLDSGEYESGLKLIAKLVLRPGCSLGYHEHHGESETFYILQGFGDFDDNGTVRQVKPGDVTFTPSGSGHALVNTGVSNLIFMALIILD